MQETKMYPAAEFDYRNAAERVRAGFQIDADWMFTERKMIVHSWQMTSVYEKGVFQVIIIALYIPNYYGGGRS